MPADEVTHGTDVDTSRGRTGPRHAAPRKPLFTRFHVPAGKAIALAAMPTAVLMGMGFTPTLANADEQPMSNSQKAEEYKACVAAMEDDASTSASPSVSPSAASSESSSGEATSAPSAPADDSPSGASPSSSSDSGSGDAATPTPTPSANKTTSGSTGGDSDKATPAPSASASAEEASGGLLETIGDAITGIFTGGDDSSGDTASTTTTSNESTETTSSAAAATPTPTASPAPSVEAADKDTTDTTTVKDTTPKATEVLKDTTDTAAKATEKAKGAADDSTASPSPSTTSSTDADDCQVATDARGDVDNTLLLPDKPWTLQASSLLLKGADYQGIVKVRTADGTEKDVLKFVISNGTEIGDLHQIVKDDLSGKTHHAQSGKGLKSEITGGKTIMYTESISGNLFGLIPLTFSPKSPPPLNIPLIYFTNVKVIQAGQFGGTLTIPFLHQYIT